MPSSRSAFFDSAREVMGNEELRIIAAELVLTVSQNAGVHRWTREHPQPDAGGGEEDPAQARLATRP